MSDSEIAKLLQDGGRAQASGQTEAAQAQYRQVLERSPEHPAALNSLGMIELGRGAAAAASELFSRAAAADPAAPPLWINLAKAQRMLRDDEGERASLQRVLEIDQRHLMALIRLAELHERLGEDAQASQRWSGVLALGRMMEERPPGLDLLLDHAAAFVAKNMSAFAERIETALEPERKDLEGRDRRRFDACLDSWLGRRSIYHNQCAGLHFPFLPADEFFDREHFPWLAELEAKTEIIRAEFEALLAGGQDGLKPYVRQDPGTPRNKWTDLDHSLNWGAYFLWEYGVRFDEACERCPQTAAILEALPRADIPGRAPTAFFSLLAPKTRIPPHTGVSNIRTIVHLPLIVPEGCGFRVGGETRQWRVGEALAFDDTIEHEAWNDSDEPRAVLIFDVWNPHLTELEKGLLQRLIAAADGGEEDARERPELKV